MKTKKRNDQDLTIIEATQGQLDTEGKSWTDKEFAHPERTIRVATSFSGIGAPEMALKRLGLKSKIVFACDIGERYLKYSYKQLAAFTAGLDEQKKKLFAQYLYDQNRANMETLRAGKTKRGEKVKPFTLEEVMNNLYKDAIDTNVVLELVKECLDMLTEGMSQDERETYIDSLYNQKGNNYIKDAFFANHTIDESSWHTDIRFMDATKYKGQVDLYVGGSPCQSYSRSGKRLGLEDTRGTLFYEFAKRIEECEPKVFIYENVKGMLSAGNGEMSGLEAALEVFSSLGYRIFWRVLNGKEYGIPQNRERVWVVGFREEREFLFPNPVPLTTGWTDYLDTEVERIDTPYTRELTGLECLRLMGFNDFKIPASLQEMDEDKRNDKLRAFAGNSMIVECLMALFKQMDITQYGAEPEEEKQENKTQMDGDWFPFLESIFSDNPATNKEIMKVRFLDPMDLSGSPSTELIKVGAVKQNKSSASDSQWDRVYSLAGICPCLTKTGKVRILVSNELCNIPRAAS